MIAAARLIITWVVFFALFGGLFQLAPLFPQVVDVGVEEEEGGIVGRNAHLIHMSTDPHVHGTV